MAHQIALAGVPIQPLFAEGRILAGFLNEQTALSCAEFLKAPKSDQDRVRRKFGVASASGAKGRKVMPKFRQVEEFDAIAVLQRVTARCGGPPTLSNLVGFEWVEIAGIGAGRYVAGPMPRPGRFPTSTSPIAEVAQYCLLGTSIIPEEDLTFTAMPTDIVVVSPEKLRLHPFLHPSPGPQGGLLVEYLIEREPSPISLLYADDRLLVLTHQERLVALMEAGIKEALCLVHYGYGTEAIGLLSTIEASILESERQPQIEDFLRPEVAVPIPVSKPRILITLSQHTTDLALIE